MKEQIDLIRQDILEVKERTGVEATLVAVTKNRSTQMIRELHRYGVMDIGENRVQELLEKVSDIPKDMRIHFIGHLQRNKVRQVVPIAHLIHSLDSIRLAYEIDKQAERIGKRQQVLVQINLAREENKFGFYEEEIKEAMREFEELAHLDVRGFMMMAPFDEEPAQLRALFSHAKLIFDYYRKTLYNNSRISILSMGMSGDYREALESGSNMVRIGSRIFE
ncbi:MAG: YggS family pyridoxal phosphate-dependent enzyme [Tissierellia bacterium]|nr:YggS family pyridoxal phosphate-dependent enzyme [Tissierellia bacterium]